MAYKGKYYAILTWILACNCSAFDFDVERSIDEVVIPGDATDYASNMLVPPEIIPPQSWSQQLPQEPSAIFVERFEISITNTAREADTDVDDFDWLERIVFYAESTMPNSALGRHPIAWVDKPGKKVRLELETNKALNLVPYLLEGLTVSSHVEGRVPPDDISLIGKARLGVDAL
jgi:hypothetical protein